jgi:hypothetical protein
MCQVNLARYQHLRLVTSRMLETRVSGKANAVYTPQRNNCYMRSRTGLAPSYLFARSLGLVGIIRVGRRHNLGIVFAFPLPLFFIFAKAQIPMDFKPASGIERNKWIGSCILSCMAGLLRSDPISSPPLLYPGQLLLMPSSPRGEVMSM